MGSFPAITKGEGTARPRVLKAKQAWALLPHSPLGGDRTPAERKALLSPVP